MVADTCLFGSTGKAVVPPSCATLASFAWSWDKRRHLCRSREGRRGRGRPGSSASSGRTSFVVFTRPPHTHRSSSEPGRCGSGVHVWNVLPPPATPSCSRFTPLPFKFLSKPSMIIKPHALRGRAPYFSRGHRLQLQLISGLILLPASAFDNHTPRVCFRLSFAAISGEPDT